MNLDDHTAMSTTSDSITV